MKTLIEQLRDGEIAVKNDGSNYSLQKVLRAAFPKDYGTCGSYPFYVKPGSNNYEFVGKDSYTGTSYSVEVFIKELDNKTKQQMRTITPEQAQSIIDISCEAWKPKLAQMWAKDICLKCRITVEEDFYREMRKACTDEQNVLFDKIFGKEVKYKVGDWVLTDSQANGWGAFPEDINDKVIKITEINLNEVSELGGRYSFDKGRFVGKSIVRLATPEEILLATFPPKGTPCMVTDNKTDWYIRISNGDGTFGMTLGTHRKWQYRFVLDPKVIKELGF